MSAANQSDPKVQPLTIADIGQQHVGRTIAVLGYPPRVLGSIVSRTPKSAEIWLGEHHLFIPNSAPVTIVETEEVDGL